jgi:hypothetical protein
MPTGVAQFAKQTSIILTASLATVWGMPSLADGPEVTLSGEARIRYESLDGQFRVGRTGSDQAVFLRALVQAEVENDRWRLGIELQDSRAYLDDTGTPLSTGYANPLDILQLYAACDLDGLVGEGSETRITLGRQTVSIGSKRQIERIEYANVIKSYTGLHARTRTARGDEFHLLAVVPVGRHPGDRAGIGENRLSADEEEWNRLIWGLHYRRNDALADLASDIWVEAFAYGLRETDSRSVPTPNRDYLTLGGRIFRTPGAGEVDWDIEAAWRTGQRRATSAVGDTTDLDVDASMIFAALGFTWDGPWQPRLALEYYWASGDEDPGDDRYGQYERLFGSRRGDLNNTSLHGPLTPANLSAPGLRLEVKPGPRSDARVTWSAAHLASSTDAWVVAGQRDASGQSGDFIGHAFDARARYWLVPDSLRLEIGASILLPGAFAESAPGATGFDRTLFGFAQMTANF